MLENIAIEIAEELNNAGINAVTAFNASELEDVRSEERRVGKECRSRWSPYH